MVELTRRGFFGRVVGGVAAAAIAQPTVEEPYRSCTNEVPPLTAADLEWVSGRPLYGRSPIETLRDRIDVTSFGDTERLYSYKYHYVDALGFETPTRQP